MQLTPPRSSSSDQQNRKVQKKSLTVLSDGHSIEVTSAHRILVDGKKVETPVLVGESASVTRDGERVRVTSQYGLTVDCNLRFDVCSLDITGWHFGKTGGLLGTYDNEPANDLALPTGELTGADDLEGFADAWRVGRKQCRPTNHASTNQQPKVDRGLAREAQDLCASYFLVSGGWRGTYPDPERESFKTTANRYRSAKRHVVLRCRDSHYVSVALRYRNVAFLFTFKFSERNSN